MDQSEPPRFRLQKVQSSNPGTILGGNTENRDYSAMGEGSSRTDISPDVDNDENLRAYVQLLESNLLKVTQLEQDIRGATQQGIFIPSLGDQTHVTSGIGSRQFDAEYARWQEKQNWKINELRAAVNSNATDIELRKIVDDVLVHYDEIFRLKGVAAKADVFNLFSGTWTTPAERCFMWLCGFRASELVELLKIHLGPLTEQQMSDISILQQWAKKTEDALSLKMEAQRRVVVEALSTGAPASSGSSGNVADYMEQMTKAMDILGTFSGFIVMGDNVRRHSLLRMNQILTTRQSARSHLAIHDYFLRQRALNSVWQARPKG